MTFGPLQILLLAGACLCLIGLAFSGILVSRAQQQRERQPALSSRHLRPRPLQGGGKTRTTDRDRPHPTLRKALAQTLRKALRQRKVGCSQRPLLPQQLPADPTACAGAGRWR